jgi:hypothetical protein
VGVAPLRGVISSTVTPGLRPGLKYSAPSELILYAAFHLPTLEISSHRDPESLLHSLTRVVNLSRRKWIRKTKILASEGGQD